MNTNDFSRAGFDDLNETPGKFYKEIIESYRMIFGQDKHSWKLFRSTAAGKLLEHSSKAERNDPLLRDLCNKRWLEQDVYRDINAGPAKLVYPASDFVYFADRLLTLQDFVLMERPNDWKSLWHDRRDIGRFWALWAVVWFGGITIFLTIIQIGLGFAQMFTSK